jgi:hypothetical protein
MKFRNVFSTFTAGEAEAITGVTAVMQRDWRRHEYLRAQSEGWSKHDTHALAQMIFMKAMADVGVGPSISGPVSQSAAMRIEYFAFSQPNAVADNTGGQFMQFVRARKESVASFFIRWTNKSEVESWAIVWRDRSVAFATDLRDAVKGIAPEVRSSMIAVDLDLLGSILAQRAGRPLVTVEGKE